MCCCCGPKCRKFPLAVFLLIVFILCMLTMCASFTAGTFGRYGPFAIIWVTLGLGIIMCILSYIFVHANPQKSWGVINSWTKMRDHLQKVELPAQYAYLGPGIGPPKYTHHMVIIRYELIYDSPSGHITNPSSATDAKLYVSEYIDSFFPKMWYYRPRFICCCPKRQRCCCWGWVGAGQIQRRQYLASELIKDKKLIFHVADNGGIPHEHRESRLRRLDQRCGEPFWDLMLNNCEHYSNWVMTGEHYAYQVATGPFWELYFLNSIGKLLMGAMHNAIINILIRVLSIIMFVIVNALAKAYVQFLYWVTIDVILLYEFMYIIVDVAKVTHLMRCCGKQPCCYICYSDYQDNSPSWDNLVLPAKTRDKVVPISHGQVQIVVDWPHEGLKFSNQYSMPIAPCIFKSIFMFLMIFCCLYGSSIIGRTILPLGNGVPWGEMICSISSVLGVYLFWYPLMASSLDYFLWHKPNCFFSLIIYLIFAGAVGYLTVNVVYAYFQAEQSYYAAPSNSSTIF